MTRRERIVVLLENYMDVEHGLQDPRFRKGDEIPRMCRAWSHPSYAELRRIVPVLRDSKPLVYWHLAETYFRFHERRVAYCPRCERTSSPDHVGQFHKHGPKTFSLIPKVERKVSLAVKPELVDLGVDWLNENFRGEPFIPDDLLAAVA